MVFIFIPSFTQKFFLNLSFFLLLNVNAILRNKENQLLTLGDFHIFPTIKVNVDQQLFGYPDSPEYIILCSAQERNEYRFGTTWEWLNYDRN